MLLTGLALMIIQGIISTGLMLTLLLLLVTSFGRPFHQFSTMLFHNLHQVVSIEFANLLLAFIQIILANLFEKNLCYGKKIKRSTLNSSVTHTVMVLMLYVELFTPTPTDFNLVPLILVMFTAFYRFVNEKLSSR